MPKKIRQLRAMLLQAGFVQCSGKGSHRNFSHPTVANVRVTLSRGDGDDADRYHEKQVTTALKQIKDALTQ